MAVTRRPRPWRNGLIAALAFLAPTEAPAQAGGIPGASSEGSGARWWPESFVVAPLLAAPHEVRLRGGVVSVKRDREDYPGRSTEALVDIGIRVPVLLFQVTETEPALEVGFEVGTFSRFERDFINIDFRVGLPVGFHAGAWDLRATPLHESSHVGDEYLERFGPPLVTVDREAIELVAGYRPTPVARAYIGADWNFGRGRATVGSGEPDDPQREVHTVEAWRLRLGAELDSARDPGRRWGPYAAVHLETTDQTERLSTNVVAGVWIPLRALRLRVGLEVHDGPSPMGQFRTVEETFWGLSAGLEIW